MLSAYATATKRSWRAHQKNVTCSINTSARETRAADFASRHDAHRRADILVAEELLDFAQVALHAARSNRIENTGRQWNQN